MNSTCSRIKIEIGKEYCGFDQDTGTRNVGSEGCQVQKDLYLCFLDCTMAFDKIQHEELFEILEH